MRRNEFARKHNVSYDTIRHYLEFGLLVPKMRGRQYSFNDDDNADMETIAQLKTLNFSLGEIQKILTIRRVMDSGTNEYNKFLLALFEGKKRQVEQKISELSNVNYILNEKINNLKHTTQKPLLKRLGFSMSNIELLECPKCNSPLLVSGGTIEENAISNANIHCECGYSAIIKDGIYIDPQTAKQKLLKSGIRLPSLNEYLEVVSPKYINFEYQAMSIMSDMIKKYDPQPQYILELNFCVGFFLTQFIHELSRNTTYILVDYDYDNLLRLKYKLINEYNHKKFIFFCCDIETLPIKKGAIDIILDQWMPKCYVSPDNQSVIDKVFPFLKDGGLMSGAYHYLKTCGGNKPNLSPRIKSYYNRDRLMEQLTRANLRMLESIDMGPTDENNPYNEEIKGMEVYQTVYTAEKGFYPKM